VQSIRSILPIVDEFVIALGPSDDQTQPMIEAIRDTKIRIVPTIWNENIRGDKGIQGYVYGQQKSIALFNCTGDWAFYLEGDEVVHEDDLPKIQEAMRCHLEDTEVEALVFDYIHFYGNANTYAWSPRWYRRAPRIIRNTIPVWAPKGLFFIVMKDHKTGRYPRAAHTGATIYHYGWVRSEEQMNLRRRATGKYWRNEVSALQYSEIDPSILRRFTGTHPKAILDWLPPAEGLFAVNRNHHLTYRERKHRLMLRLERDLGLKLGKCHYKLIR
jgi:glycosyltransferase involved in cell wall biosynthesis